MRSDSNGPRFGMFAAYGLVKLLAIAGVVTGAVYVWGAMDPAWPAWQRVGLMTLTIGGGIAVLKGLRFAAWRRMGHRHGFAGHCGCSCEPTATPTA